MWEVLPGTNSRPLMWCGPAAPGIVTGVVKSTARFDGSNIGGAASSLDLVIGPSPGTSGKFKVTGYLAVRGVITGGRWVFVLGVSFFDVCFPIGFYLEFMFSLETLPFSSFRCSRPLQLPREVGPTTTLETMWLILYKEGVYIFAGATPFSISLVVPSSGGSQWGSCGRSSILTKSCLAVSRPS